jgi:hypothetical protein
MSGDWAWKQAVRINSLFHVCSIFWCSLSRISSKKHQKMQELCLFPLYLAVTRQLFLLELVTTSIGHFTAQSVIFTIICVEHMAPVSFLLDSWLVFEGPVQSGLWAYFWKDRDRTGLYIFWDLKKPDWTALDQSFSV